MAYAGAMNTFHPHPPDGAPAFADAAALASHLERVGLFRMLPGLDRMAAVLESLKLRRPPYFLAQVVGTNGKGSVSTMLAALAREHGLSVGLHTSPHFLSVRERVRINGDLLDDDHWLRLANTLMRHGAESLSYFEFVTCLAALAFAEAGVDVAVMESGLGGRYDATTALAADVLIVTPISLDHQEILGHSLAEIAADKAGAIRPGTAVFTGVQPPEVMEELQRVSEARAAPLHLVSPSAALPDPGRYPLRLEGDHQRDNARLALAAWRHIRDMSVRAPGRERMAAAMRGAGKAALEGRALAGAWLPGRFQRVAPLSGTDRRLPYSPCPLGWPPLLLDGAHNAHGMAALGRSLALRRIAPAAVIFACLADKRPHSLAPHLRALALGPVFVPPIADNPRAMPPEELASIIGLNAVPTPSLQGALEAACALMASRLPEAFSGQEARRPLLICGSLYLLAQFYSLRRDCLTPAAFPEAKPAHRRKPRAQGCAP
jgi:dihydrofolate synthase/folylpolyglutamate synthase